MGILIADSGGSHTHWRIVSTQGLRSLQTLGLNPNLVSTDEVEAILDGEVKPFIAATTINAVHFYGAGLGSARSQDQRRSQLQQHLGLSCPIHVHTDLMAAALAALGSSSGLVGILGTGSVAFRFDGEAIVERRGGLGFLLGDEGSGVALGRGLLRLILNGNASQTLEKAFESFSALDLQEIRQQRDKSSTLAKTLAGLAPFLNRFKDDPQIAAILSQQFHFFLQYDIKPLIHTGQERLVLVGGIARNFADSLRHEARLLGIQEPEILHDLPIERLSDHWLQEKGE